MPECLRIVVYLMIFMLPTASNLIKHASSVILAVLTLLGIYAWLTRKTRPAFDRAEKSVMGAFAAYFIICLLFFLAHGIFGTGDSLQWNLGHELRMLAFIPIYFLLYQTGLKSWPLWYGTAIAAIINGIYSIFYIYGAAGQRARAAYYAIAFGDISLVLGFMCLAGIRYFQQRHSAYAIIPIMAVALGILASFLSGTRGAVIAIPFLALIFFIQLGRFKRPWCARGILILSIVVLSTAYYHLPGSSLNHRIQAGLSETEAFFQGKEVGPYAVRLGIWAEGWKMFLEHPVCGWGKKGYEKMIQQKNEKKEIPEIIGQFTCPHSMYLSLMTDYGISGLLILLGIFLSPLIILIPAVKGNSLARDIGFTGITLIVAFMIFALTETIFNRNIFISIYIILMAAVTSLASQYKKSE